MPWACREHDASMHAAFRRTLHTPGQLLILAWGASELSVRTCLSKPPGGIPGTSRALREHAASMPGNVKTTREHPGSFPSTSGACSKHARNKSGACREPARSMPWACREHDASMLHPDARSTHQVSRLFWSDEHLGSQFAPVHQNRPHASRGNMSVTRAWDRN